MNFTFEWNWIKKIPRLVGSLSIISLLTFLKNGSFFKRTLSDTNRNFYRAWNKSLPSISPQNITAQHQPVNIILDRKRISLGMEELIPMLEIIRLSGAKRILEIGTSSGGTTWHFAANSDDDAIITTVDLPLNFSRIDYSSKNLATERPTENELGRYFLET